MRTLNFKIFTAITLLIFASCKNKANEAETKQAEDVAVAENTSVDYKVNTKKSSITWKGYKPTGSHNGTITIADGMISVNNGTVDSGTFSIDMTSIEVLDIPKEDKKNKDLRGHLSGPDFFDVEKYPNAKFEITGITAMEGKTMLSGNLTLKDTTNNISLPVAIEMKGDTMMLTSETFTIDRSKWNVKYGSKSFFDNLGDKFINDDIELNVSVVADKY